MGAHNPNKCEFKGIFFDVNDDDRDCSFINQRFFEIAQKHLFCGLYLEIQYAGNVKSNINLYSLSGIVQAKPISIHGGVIAKYKDDFDKAEQALRETFECLKSQPEAADIIISWNDFFKVLKTIAERCNLKIKQKPKSKNKWIRPVMLESGFNPPSL